VPELGALTSRQAIGHLHRMARTVPAAGHASNTARVVPGLRVSSPATSMGSAAQRAGWKAMLKQSMDACVQESGVPFTPFSL
jgi:hypothetical protein